MNLHKHLLLREAEQKPIRVGLIGAGKFGSMFLAQARLTPGMHILGIADLNPERAKQSLRQVGWSDAEYGAANFDQALRSGTCAIVDNAEALISANGLDVVIDATGSPSAGVAHVLEACEQGVNIIMVNVEADALLGPLLAQKARSAGIVYSLAYGDQPALICEMVDWARTAGFEVVCAGKGTKYLPEYHESTPATVWDHYGLSAEQAAAGGMNPQMFNSFLDGTKSAIEMAAVANATGLSAAPDGLAFPPCDVDQLAEILKPEDAGGVIAERGMVEVISSLERGGEAVERDLRWGVYTVFEAPNDYVRRCFSEYGLRTDQTGRYTSMYKPYHLIGLELGISVANVALRGEATGTPTVWQADVVATAKRNLKAGEILDGEGGYTVWGKLLPAKTSVARSALPLGLAEQCRLVKDVAAGSMLRWSDVSMDETRSIVRLRRELEQGFVPHPD